MQESPGMNSDWLGERGLFFEKKSNMVSESKRSNIFPEIGRSETGQ